MEGIATRLGWPAVAIIVVLAALPMASIIFACWKRPEAIPEIMRSLTDANIFARIIALLLVVPSIVMLGVQDAADNAAAIAALAGVAGYVLGVSSLPPPRPSDRSQREPREPKE
jgi:hypothetical protein